MHHAGAPADGHHGDEAHTTAPPVFLKFSLQANIALQCVKI